MNFIREDANFRVIVDMPIQPVLNLPGLSPIEDDVVEPEHEQEIVSNGQDEATA